MLFVSAFMAGIVISLAGFGYLQIGGIAGAILFAWGLITVIHYKLKLFTGMAGFCKTKEDYINLIEVLISNVIGCCATAFILIFSPYGDAAINSATDILSKRADVGYFACFLGAIGCGFIMTIAVKFAREGKYLPLLFGVPLFIISGFPHCIADIFYYLFACPIVSANEMIFLWISIVLGNFIGCNIPTFLEENFE